MDFGIAINTTRDIHITESESTHRIEHNAQLQLVSKSAFSNMNSIFIKKMSP